MLRRLLIVATPSLYSHTWKSHRHSHTWMSRQFPALPRSYATRLIHMCYDSCIWDMPLIHMGLVIVYGTFASCPIWMRRRFPTLLYSGCHPVPGGNYTQLISLTHLTWVACLCGMRVCRCVWCVQYAVVCVWDRSGMHDMRVCRCVLYGEVGDWGRVPFSRNLMNLTPRRKWYLTTGRRAH